MYQWCLLPHFFLFYCVMTGLLGCSVCSAIVTLVGIAVLEAKKLKQAPKEAVENVLQNHKVSIIAHRGAANDGPENTLGAIKEAKKNGADGVEFDIEFSKDGIPVLLHDDTIDRTTDGAGYVCNYTFEQLQQFNAAAKHPLKDQFKNETIPTLEEAVKLCLELNLKMYFDVKGNASKAIGSITELFKKYPELYKSAAVCSFFPQVIYGVKKADHNIVAGLTHRHKVLARKVDGSERTGPWYKQLTYPIVDVVLEWSLHTWLWYLCGTNAVLLFNKDVSRQIVERYESRGIHVLVWTPNTQQEKQYIHNVLKCSYITDTLKTQDCDPQST